MLFALRESMFVLRKICQHERFFPHQNFCANKVQDAVDYWSLKAVNWLSGQEIVLFFDLYSSTGHHSS